MSSRVEAVWAASGALAVALFACGLLFGDLLATTNFPALNTTPSHLREYFLRNVSEVRALSFFHLLAAAALAAFASYLYARLRSAGIRVAALALALDNRRRVPRDVRPLLSGAGGAFSGE
jgi:hypothetical protein